MQTRRGTEKYEQMVRAALLDGSYRSKRKPVPTIAEYVADHLRDLQSRGRKASTLVSAEALFRNWIVPRVGDRRIDEIKTSDFSTVRVAMIEAKRSGKTTNNALVGLSGLVRHWHDLLTPCRVERLAAAATSLRPLLRGPLEPSTRRDSVSRAAFLTAP